MDIEKRAHHLSERLNYIRDIFDGKHPEDIELLHNRLNEFFRRATEGIQSDPDAELTTLEELFTFMERKLETKIQPMDKVRIVRHPQRICLRDILENVYDNFTEIGGQEEHSIDPSMLIARATITRRRGEVKRTMEEKETLASQQESEAAALRAQAEESLSGQTELLRSTTRLGDEIAGRKSALAGFAAERETTEKSLASLESLRAQMRGDEQSRKTLIEQYKAASEQARREITAHEEEIAALSEKMAEKRAALEELSRAKLSLEAERSQSDRRGRELNENVLNVERSVSKLEQKRATSAMEEQQILDRLWENYELSHSAAQEQRIELESVQKASRRIGELKRAISGLGSVNVGAIEEFERVNTRYTYLTEQRDDVEKAKSELVGVIESITGEMTVIFKEQFALIRESFQETFLELFGGGKATLELEDENDVLSCGIEIKVQPPGKALKTITLLSGGEKAFVAIALYFAILKVHPTPFCVMDEIEAALDEPNVVRVANYMRRITQKTQFIVITHRRGTMEAADVLYGVTMQERGVSKILTINMNDMAKELNIKE